MSHMYKNFGQTFYSYSNMSIVLFNVKERLNCSDNSTSFGVDMAPLLLSFVTMTSQIGMVT